MQQKNLVLQWIRQCPAAQCRTISDRIRAQIDEVAAAPNTGEGPDLARLIATILFVECAQDLDLTPLELHGLLEDPRRQCMEAVAFMALDWISQAPDPRPRVGSNRARHTDCSHVA